MEPEELKKVRDRLGLTQQGFALLLGLVAKNVVSNLETGFRQSSGVVVRLFLFLAHLPIREARELVQRPEVNDQSGGNGVED